MTTIRNNNQSNGGTKAPIDLKSEFAKQINGGVKTDSEGAALLSASDPSAGRFLSWQESGKTTAWLDDGKLWKRKLDDTKSIADSNGDGVTDILGLDAAKPGKTVVKTFNRDGQSQDSEQDLGVPWEDGKQIVELDHIFADVNGDGLVNGADLAALLGSWGWTA